LKKFCRKYEFYLHQQNQFYPTPFSPGRILPVEQREGHETKTSRRRFAEGQACSTHKFESLVDIYSSEETDFDFRRCCG
jgi:hypothetical protein